MTDQMDTRSQILLDRIDHLPRWPFPNYVLPIVGFAYFFAFYDVILMGMALPKIMQTFHINQTAVAWSITSSLIGYIIGSFVDARLSDRFGRRLSLSFSILIYVIGAILCAASTDYDMFIAARFINGLGIGAEIACAVSYLSELAPKKVRGKVTVLAASYGFISFSVTPFICMFILVYLQTSWRYLFVIGVIGGLITLILRRYIPRSPRWLVLHNRINEAEITVDKAELFIEKRFPHYQPQKEDTPSLTKEPHASLFNPLYMGRLILLIFIFGIYYIGNYAWLTVAPTLLVDLGFSFAHSILFIAISSLGFICGCFVGYQLVDRFERKWICFCLAIIWTAVLLIIGFHPTEITIIILGFIACTTISSIMPIMYLFAAENFPTACRATGVSLSDGLGHIGGAFCAQITFAAYNLFTTPHVSFASSFSAMAISGLLTAMLFIFGIRTTGSKLLT